MDNATGITKKIVGVPVKGVERPIVRPTEPSVASTSVWIPRFKQERSSMFAKSEKVDSQQNSLPTEISRAETKLKPETIPELNKDVERLQYSGERQPRASSTKDKVDNVICGEEETSDNIKAALTKLRKERAQMQGKVSTQKRKEKVLHHDIQTKECEIQRQTFKVEDFNEIRKEVLRRWQVAKNSKKEMIKEKIIIEADLESAKHVRQLDETELGELKEKIFHLEDKLQTFSEKRISSADGKAREGNIEKSDEDNKPATTVELLEKKERPVGEGSSRSIRNRPKARRVDHFQTTIKLEQSVQRRSSPTKPTLTRSPSLVKIEEDTSELASEHELCNILVKTNGQADEYENDEMKYDRSTGNENGLGERPTSESEWSDRPLAERSQYAGGLSDLQPDGNYAAAREPSSLGHDSNIATPYMNRVHLPNRRVVQPVVEETSSDDSYHSFSSVTVKDTNKRQACGGHAYRPLTKRRRSQ